MRGCKAVAGPADAHRTRLLRRTAGRRCTGSSAITGQARRRERTRTSCCCSEETAGVEGFAPRNTAHLRRHDSTVPNHPLLASPSPASPLVEAVRPALDSRAALLLACAAGLSIFLDAPALAEAVVPVDTVTYVPGPVEVTWQIYVGAAVGVFPFILGAYEFGKRILIQRRCPECNGIGLVRRGKGMRKCGECGGFFPWLGWKKFFTSTAAPGNGGPLLAPRGQTSVFYKVPPKRENASAAEAPQDEGRDAADPRAP